MPGFTIPNTPDPAIANTNQAEPDSVDFQILGQQTNGVVSGCAVTPAVGSGPPKVAVATGEVLINGVYRTLTANPSLNLTSYGSATFFEVVIARASGSGAVAEVLAGTASNTNPQFPTVDFSNSVVLAAIWRTGNSDLGASAVIDKRMFVRSNANRVVAGTTDNAIGASGDTWVNSSWSPGTDLASPLSVKVGGTWYNVARTTDSFTVSGTITAGGFSTAGTATVGSVTISPAGTVTATTFSGNATTASRWANTRTISLTGNATGSANIDGTGNIAISTTVSGLTGGNGKAIYDTGFYSWQVAGALYLDSFLSVSSSITTSSFLSALSLYTSSSSVYFNNLGTTGSAANARILADGRLAYNTSVRDIKDNIQPMGDGLNIIKALRPRTFSLKPQPMDTVVDQYIREQGIPTFGFIVDEIQVDAPELLDYIQDTGGNIKPIMWKTNDLIAILTKAVQELAARVEALEAQ